MRFLQTDHAQEERVQQQSGGWAMTGQMPVPSEGWTPFKT
jgi:hypothetical protein